MSGHPRGRVDLYCGIGEAPWTLRSRVGKGCVWCGEAIVLFDPFDHRRRARTRHRGDEHELGDGRNCHREFMRSYYWTARELVERRGDPCCVYCGEITDRWEADHQVPLVEDGGGHDPTNIVRACVPCHRSKTAAEARARAAHRRQQRGLPEPLPAHNPGQSSLLTA